MSKKKSEKEAKEKKLAAKKAPAKAIQPATVPEAEPKPRKKAKDAPRKKAAKVSISGEDIAMRAYFIAERRHKMGWPGDSTSDWVEAESQLKAEAAKKK